MHALARPLTLALLLLSLSPSLSLTTGCSTKQVYNRQDLEMTLAQHHINLRWGRAAVASAQVHPDLRIAFVQYWQNIGQKYEIQEVEIQEILYQEGQDEAEVFIAVSWLDPETFQLKSGTMVEKWLRTDSGWQAVRTLELPNTGNGSNTANPLPLTNSATIDPAL